MFKFLYLVISNFPTDLHVGSYVALMPAERICNANCSENKDI